MLTEAQLKALLESMDEEEDIYDPFGFYDFFQKRWVPVAVFCKSRAELEAATIDLIKAFLASDHEEEIKLLAKTITDTVEDEVNSYTTTESYGSTGANTLQTVNTKGWN